MTEEEAFNNKEMKVILLLSGFVRELAEGGDYETLNYALAERIVKLFSIPDVINWVACSDEMPPENIKIYIFGKGEIYEESIYTKKDGFEGRFTDDVTHWMEFPKPPCL